MLAVRDERVEKEKREKAKEAALVVGVTLFSSSSLLPLLLLGFWGRRLSLKVAAGAQNSGEEVGEKRKRTPCGGQVIQQGELKDETQHNDHRMQGHAAKKNLQKQKEGGNGERRPGEEGKEERREWRRSGRRETKHDEGVSS